MPTIVISSTRATRLDLAFDEGDTAPVTLTFQTTLGAPIDYSGSTFVASMKKHLSSATEFPIAVDDTDKATGVLIITPPVTEGLPNPGIWDLRRDNAGSITTLLKGKTFVDRRVTAIP